MLSADDLSRAAKAAPIKTVEMDYSLANRSIEQNGVLGVARQNDIDVLAIDLSCEDVRRTEKAFPADRLQGMHMRNLVFRDGRIVGR